MIDQIKNSFKFLETNYNCVIKNTNTDNDYIKVEYQNDTTGINISFESKDSLVRIELVRLSDSKKIDFENLIKLRAPEKKFKQLLSPLLFSNKEFEKVVKEYAEILKSRGEDVLKGNFDIFQENT